MATFESAVANLHTDHPLTLRDLRMREMELIAVIQNRIAVAALKAESLPPTCNSELLAPEPMRSIKISSSALV